MIAYFITTNTRTRRHRKPMRLVSQPKHRGNKKNQRKLIGWRENIEKTSRKPKKNKKNNIFPTEHGIVQVRLVFW